MLLPFTSIRFLYPFDAEEQWVYFDLPSDEVSHLISKADSSSLVDRAHFSRLCLGSCSFGHKLYLMTICKGENIDGLEH